MFSLRSVLGRFKDHRKHIKHQEASSQNNGEGNQPEIQRVEARYVAPTRSYQFDLSSQNSPKQDPQEIDDGTTCPTCGGDGKAWATYNGYNRGTVGSEYETCWRCGGTGKI